MSRIRTSQVRTPAPVALREAPIFRSFWLWAIACTLAFGWPLAELATFSWRSELYSHVLLIPAVSLYLAWMKSPKLPSISGRDRGTAVILFTCTGILLALYGVLRQRSAGLEQEDRLAILVLAWVAAVSGLGAWLLGPARFAALRFPFAFLALAAPFPSPLVGGVETFLQHGSAFAAHGLFKVIGTPVFYHELHFQLPGIVLEVAPQCSGIHSSLALFITSLVAGQFFLRSPWKRVLLAAAVVPLAIVRNGFRIFTIGELCVRISPDMVNSYIHHNGGPIFFALSLIPFSLILYLLYRSDRARPLVNATA